MKYADLRKRGVTSKSWTTAKGIVRHRNLVTKGLVCKIFSNPVYIGIAAYKGQHYPGEHVGIIDRALWDTVQTHLKNGTPMNKARLAGRGCVPSHLRGLLFSEQGEPLRPAGLERKTRPTATTLTPTRLRSARKVVMFGASRPARSNSW